MKLHLFEYTCDDCGTVFKAPEYVGGYGELLLRSTGQGSQRIVHAQDDKAFDEVGRLVEGMYPDVAAALRGELAQAAFSVACDVDTDGSPFVIGAAPRCPVCGSHRMRHFQATEPPELVEVDVPQVTHEAWNAMTPGQRKEAVAAAARAWLSGAR